MFVDLTTLYVIMFSIFATSYKYIYIYISFFGGVGAVSNISLLAVRQACTWYDIFVNCNWVVSRWQKYSTHLHTNNT